MDAMRQISENVSTNAKWNMAFWCTFYGIGIISTLVLYGVLQERIMTVPFGGELFTVSAFLVFCNRTVNVVYAGMMINVKGETMENNAPLWKYLIISFSNVAATTCQYECLKYVSFPVQMLGKSFKMMPVMLWGIIISNKKHGCIDWAVAACVTFGVTEFLMTGPMGSPNDNANSARGLGLLVMFLAFDGLTSTFQEKLFKEHNTSKFNQMLYVNGFSAAVSLASLLAAGQLSYCFGFCLAHGDFFSNAMLLSAAAAGSQYFIYSQVKEFGALVFAATMNVRQVVSILVSYATYDHSITLLQVTGLMLIFSALFYKSYASLMEQHKDKEKALSLPKYSKEASTECEKEPLMPKSGKDVSA
jgi:adenosine 3'-phospho 5'-phosphosulfate transporter B2